MCKNDVLDEFQSKKYPNSNQQTERKLKRR